MSFYLIDVSRYQGAIDWRRVAANTDMAGGIVKSSEGLNATSSGTDAYFWSTASQMVASGNPIMGAYHWLRPGNAAAQADMFYARTKKAFGAKFDQCLFQLDAEDKTYPLRPTDVTEFEARWAEITGGHPLALYLPRWYWSPKTSNFSGIVGPNPWWQSAYVTGQVGTGWHLAGQRASAGWSAFGGVVPTILQFTENARVNGVPNNLCDVNLVRMDLAAFQAKYTRASVTNGGGGPALTVNKVAAPKPTPQRKAKPMYLIKADDPKDSRVWLTDGFQARLLRDDAELGEVKALMGFNSLDQRVSPVKHLDHYGVK